jgi:hypothetical protein
MRQHWQFRGREGFFRPGKEIERLREAHKKSPRSAKSEIDTARACPGPDPGAEKDPFRTDTSYWMCAMLLFSIEPDNAFQMRRMRKKIDWLYLFYVVCPEKKGRIPGQTCRIA